MSMWQITRVRRTVAAASLTAALAFTLSACGDEGDGNRSANTVAGQGTEGGKGGERAKRPEQARQPEQPDDSRVIATLQGADGISLDVTSATRDSGGFVTINGVIKNSSDSEYFGTDFWTGPELALQKGAGGGSLGGASLIDKAEKKRYYTLRDTEDRPLTTLGLSSIKPHSENRVFMQFPAPPKSTTDVDLQIPTFQSASLALTDA
ncbi:hypothetical protein [Streptomyces olivaceiscleroticus]|uniref:DUF4352 domain-containing protein n=1 Tax=Streptomyces olivaceiscleroticus TaxID=68245 RepID=A0ABN1B086_9ACTN